MEKFLVFAYTDYYPSGGLNDIVSNSDTLETVDIKAIGNDHIEALDTQTGDLWYWNDREWIMTDTVDGELKKREAYNQKIAERFAKAKREPSEGLLVPVEFSKAILELALSPLSIPCMVKDV